MPKNIGRRAGRVNRTLRSHRAIRLYRMLVSALLIVWMAFYAAGYRSAPVIDRIEAGLYDLRLRATLPQTRDKRIVIIDIDEQSLLAEGRWPWPRNKMSYLVDLLFDYYGIQLVAFDIVFAEADTSSGLDMLHTLKEGPLRDSPDFARVLTQLEPQLRYDQLFANSLARRKAIMGYYTSHRANEINPLSALPAPLMNADALPFSNHLFQARSFGANLTPLQQATGRGGFFNNPHLDDDGVYRRIPMLIQYQDGIYESLALATLRALFDISALNFITGDYRQQGQRQQPLEHILADTLRIPVDQRATLLIPYLGDAGSFDYIPATEVLNGITPIDALQDKIVFVGTSAAGLQDLVTTPVHAAFPGVEVHANIVSGVLDQRIKWRPDYLPVVEALSLLLCGLLAAVAFQLLSALQATLVAALLMALAIFTSGYLWSRYHLDLHLASLLLLLGMLYSVQMAFSYLYESKRKKHLSRIFGHYIPPELVDVMSQSDENFSLKGESREMTVLFSDVRGFTTISETLSPEVLCELINEILTPITTIIHEHHGTIDKYIGDAVMAFWGAPLTDTDHATHAVQAALKIITALEERQDQFAARGWPPVRMGIGLNTGKMNVGNMGSEFRLSYTVMGDAVNLGSRLEGLTKQYGVCLIVSEFTRAAAPGFLYKELDRVRVKGKNEPITIYEPVALLTEASAAQLTETGAMSQALRRFRAQHWESARHAFMTLLATGTNNLLYESYLDRIAHYQQEPPPRNWDGVFTHKTK